MKTSGALNRARKAEGDGSGVIAFVVGEISDPIRTAGTVVNSDQHY